jgi:hypothetical protein
MRIVPVAIALAVVAVQSAAAQTQKPRVAGIARPPQATQPVSSGSANSTQMTVGSVPVLVTPDGRIYANFGYGYEPVIRACGYHPAASAAPAYRPSHVPSGQTAGSQSSGSTPPTYQPSTFGPGNTQPAPAQPTESERMLPQGYAPPNAGAGQERAGSTACYTTDPRGQIIIIR